MSLLFPLWYKSYCTVTGKESHSHHRHSQFPPEDKDSFLPKSNGFRTGMVWSWWRADVTNILTPCMMPTCLHCQASFPSVSFSFFGLDGVQWRTIFWFPKHMNCNFPVKRNNLTPVPLLLHLHTVKQTSNRIYHVSGNLIQQIWSKVNIWRI